MYDVRYSLGIVRWSNESMNLRCRFVKNLKSRPSSEMVQGKSS